jgi:septum formation protein
MAPLILASASPRRAALLREAGLAFEVVPSAADELLLDQLTATELARVNAYRKAAVVARAHPEALVLGADTIVCREGRSFGKPADLEEARQMLSDLQGKTHEVVTGVCLLCWKEQRRSVFTECTYVRFRTLTDLEIAAYLAAISPLDKAGAYAIQEQGELIVKSISGSYSNVVGLPMERLQFELAAWSAPPPAPRRPRTMHGQDLL